ncbi:MAG: hypothetical protein U7127_04855 [Phormidium sp.]
MQLDEFAIALYLLYKMIAFITPIPKEIALLFPCPKIGDGTLHTYSKSDRTSVPLY